MRGAAGAWAERRMLEAGADAQEEDDDVLSKVPYFGALRKRFLDAERAAACKRKCAYYAGWPGLDDEQRAALIASGGSLSLKRDRPRGYIYLGKFDAEWLGWQAQP